MGVESNKPFFSIVTVCYNSEKTIKRTIESVLSQSFLNYEYIIVDGDSTDETIDIIKSYEPLFNGRMSWRSEPDNGIYDAFNKGIIRSNGIYVWIVNSDDYIQPGALQYIFEELKSFQHGKEPILSCSLNYIDEKSGNILRKRFYSEVDSKKYFKRDQTGVVHPATLVPKRVYLEAGLFDDRFKLLGDNDWFHRTYSLKYPFLFLNHVITNMSNGGVSGQWSFRRYKISFFDRKIYYKKHYSCLVERMLRFMVWNLHFVSIILRSLFKE